MQLASEAFNSTMEIMLDSNSTDNASSPVNTTHSGFSNNPYKAFIKAAFSSAIFMFVSMFVTILANNLLLLAFCVDPLKIFRKPTTYFLIGLAIVDIVTALSVEPIFATCFTLLYLQHPLVIKCPPIMDFGFYFGAFGMAASFFIVLVFTVTQYIVVSSPLKYGHLVTKRKVLISVAVIYLYSAAFWCLYLMVLSRYPHSDPQKKMAAGNPLRGQTETQDTGKHIQVQRNFVRVNFMLLAVLIVCSMPGVVFWTIHKFTKDNVFTANDLIANLMVDNLLYLKFLLDPFVYAWRMPKNRESLNKIVCRKNIDRESIQNGNQNTLAVGISHDGELSTELNKSAITLLSFKNIEVSTVPIERTSCMTENDKDGESSRIKNDSKVTT
ncbi:hypothetical protein ACROYT_G034317 [Oculina patagonica]